MNTSYFFLKLRKSIQNVITLGLAFMILSTSFLVYSKVAPSELSVEDLEKAQFVQQQMELEERQSLAQWLSNKYKVPENKAQLFVETAYQESEKFSDVSPFLILAVIEKESSLKEFATNSYGAVGLMQVVPRWHPEKLAKGKDPVSQLKNPVTNIRVGALILSEYLKKSSGDLRKALTKYSGNASNYTEKVVKNKEKLKEVAEQSRKKFLYNQY